MKCITMESSASPRSGLLFLGACLALAAAPVRADGPSLECLEVPWCPPLVLHPVTLDTCFQESATSYPPGLFWTGESWINASVARDHRPMAVIYLSEPSLARWDGFFGNPEGLKTWWRARCDGQFVPDLPDVNPVTGQPRQIEALVERMTRLVEDFGFRRIMLYLPAGEYFGRRFMAPGNVEYFDGQDIPVSQWYGMPPWKRAHFSTESVGSPLRQFLDTHHVSIEIYMGSALMHDPCTLHAHALHELHPSIAVPATPATPYVADLPVLINGQVVPDRPRWLVPGTQVEPEVAIDPRVNSHMIRMMHQFGPWGGAGIRRFWLDAAADQHCTSGGDLRRRRWGLHQLAFNPFFRSNEFRIGGENLPTLGDDGIILDTIAVRQVPYMALDSWLLELRPDPADPATHYPRWDFFGPMPMGTCKSEVHMLISDSTLVGWDLMGEARRRHYVLTVLNADEPAKEEKIRIVQRWYSMGRIHPADFNGDGVVNSIDVSDFNAVYALFNDDAPDLDRPITVFATGDINEDGKVNQLDVEYFMSCFYAAVGSLGPVRDYGDANAW